MNGKFYDVDVFEGVPRFNLTKEPIPLIGYASGNPYLAFAYSFPDQGNAIKTL